MPTDSFTDALERLDPASRALLDLSLRRGMRTEEIADVLGADPDSVAETRDEALRLVAEGVGMSDGEQLDEVRARLAELPADEWLGRPVTNGTNGSGAVAEEPEAEEPEAEVEEPPAFVVPADPEAPQCEGADAIDAAVAEAEAEAEQPADEPEPPTEEPAKKRGGVVPLLLGLLVAAGAVIAIAIATSSSDDKTTSSNRRQAQPQQPAASNPASGAGTALAPMGGSAVKGTAVVTGRRLKLVVRGLPDPGRGSYEVWLYNSVIDARSLGQRHGSLIKLNVKLPANWKHYRFLDISREPKDGNVSHSGESVARVPASRLAR